MKKIEVVAGILIHKERFLAVQRGQSAFSYTSNKWEFPGGKIEPGETHSQAIKRELEEELSVLIKEPSWFMTIEHKYPDFELEMHCFVCTLEHTSIELNEHINKKWLKRSELLDVDWAAADIPVAHKLLDDY
ncbi:(deoxy)nucleoside triphosphate pyrophosphohydrolase [Vibrio breoganii]|uniref:(deoxy)nucleoside triphosphate pyrophosphohydrolase n=1 Tax=Vibrio breoganii TaxID=553239 RepID=UPI0002E74088|nr:(deoxy)nucleoside triphosphate pyrophosphohydrolase [Vibrio breoganii]OED84647.1 DNA mismatch repair protein MutT [Vibrio breoganii ZF-55]